MMLRLLLFCLTLVAALAEIRAHAGEQPNFNASFTNSLGMRFVPVRGATVLFSIWDTRVQDYERFVRATSNAWPNPGFVQAPDHPAVNVSWIDAGKFCEWLTQMERTQGSISSNRFYRLPTDAEWSIAAGLTAESGRTPAEKSGKIENVYPWDGDWPPPHGAGNYCDGTYYRKYRELYHLMLTDQIAGYDDGFADTSPVGSFRSNRSGLFDMGGNVWQWCEDWSDASHQQRVLRGASFGGLDPKRLLSSFRNKLTPETRNYNQGFRCVVAGGLE